MEIRFQRLYRYDRPREHCQVAVPFARGARTDSGRVRITQNGACVPVQARATSLYDDGSIRYLLIRFMADLPGNRPALLELADGEEPGAPAPAFSPVSVERTGNGYVVRSGVTFSVSDGSSGLFDWLDDGCRRYEGGQFLGPRLDAGDGVSLGIRLEQWRAVETGPLVAVLRCMGRFIRPEGAVSPVTFEAKLTAWAEKPWVEVSWRVINSSEQPLHVASLEFAVTADPLPRALPPDGDHPDPLPRALPSASPVRTCAASSNYGTDYIIGENGESVSKTVDAAWLTGEANEHFAEVLYGTFFADRTDGTAGVCATVYQAQQNYPKAVKADRDGVYVMLVPRDTGRIVMESGVSREQRFLLHFHGAGETLEELNNRSLIYQMPDRPSVSPRVFADAGVMPDIFVSPDKISPETEAAFYNLADSHARCYGMLNWGDAPDPGYTSQGRGGGQPVWTNNEYDYPHACALLYARTGERRFLDYMITAVSHWMDVDVCHYSRDPLLLHGQWEHSRRHCLDSRIVCSHQWVEGLLDFYHFTGDERALETALGIGENTLRLLDTPTYQTSGESTARETGWALRTLCALYAETHEPRWSAKCDWIVNQFREWFEMYGGWISPYTDNTIIRVPFMISVAVGSLMRYYRIAAREDIRTMVLAAVDDLIDTCYMESTGLFVYKDLPSLNRLGSNTLILEALTAAYELSGDTRYLNYGRRTFQNAVRHTAGSFVSAKTVVDDAVILKGDGTKTFAQSFLPMAVYYKAMTDNNLL